MKCVVLIVEDDQTARTCLARLVEMQGHDAPTAMTIHEGRVKIADQPSHVLLDLNLPDGHGTDLLRMIREGKLPIKVAVVSASDDPRLLDEAFALHPEAMFRKPVKPDALLEWIKEE